MCYIENVNCQLVKKLPCVTVLGSFLLLITVEVVRLVGILTELLDVFLKLVPDVFPQFLPAGQRAFLNEIVTWWNVDCTWAFESVVSRVHFSIQRRIRNCRTLIFIIENLVFPGTAFLENSAKIT